MRPEFFVPDDIALGYPDVATREAVRDVLSMVSCQIPATAISRWTRFELILAYDWAWRAHLVASDHPKRLLRDKPSFVQDAQDAHKRALRAQREERSLRDYEDAVAQAMQETKSPAR